MNTEIENAEAIAGDKSSYDTEAKNLLAHILTRTVPEFRGMDPKKVVPLIEGVSVSKVPIESGATNAESTALETGKLIVGMNTEDTKVNEGMIRFDIIFYVRTPKRYGRKGRLMKVIVNIEMQKDEPTKYDILNRAVFYVSRLISSQKERDFPSDDYDGLQRVYSIWIMAGSRECTLNHIHLCDDNLLGNKTWRGDIGLLNIVMIGLPDELPEQGKEELELYRLLGALLSDSLGYGEKMEILKGEYRIDEDAEMRKEVTQMCNLSEGIVERTTERVTKSVTESERRRSVLGMHRAGAPDDMIAQGMDMPVADVEQIIAEDQSATA